MATQILATLSARTRKHAPQAASPSLVTSVGVRSSTKAFTSTSETVHASGVGSHPKCIAATLPNSQKIAVDALLQTTVRPISSRKGPKYNVQPKWSTRQNEAQLGRDFSKGRLQENTSASSSLNMSMKLKPCHVHMHETQNELSLQKRTSVELDVRSQLTCQASSSAASGTQEHTEVVAGQVSSRVAPQQS